MPKPPAREPGWLLSVRFWPLALILTVQAALSLRLARGAAALTAELASQSAGHRELAHLLRHAPAPHAAGIAAGSPLAYPPLAAIAENIGGLSGARLLSLAFMLIATVALHGVTKRLMPGDGSAPFFAAVAFGWLGPAPFLGSVATGDAMALMLLALATWLGVLAVAARGAPRHALLCAGGLALALAAATSYASVLLVPVVIAVVAVAGWHSDSVRAGLDAAGLLILVTALPLTAGLDLAGPAYGHAVAAALTSPAAKTSPVQALLALRGRQAIVIEVLAVAGAAVLTVRRLRWPVVTLAWIMAAAGSLALAEQARNHVVSSLFSGTALAWWLACAIGGYLLAGIPGLLARLARSVRHREHPQEH